MRLQDLIPVYVTNFKVKGDAALRAICNCDVPRAIVLNEYKKYPPIEQDAEFGDYLGIAKELFPDADYDKTLKAAKVIYTMANLIQHE